MNISGQNLAHNIFIANKQANEVLNAPFARPSQQNQPLLEVVASKRVKLLVM